MKKTIFSETQKKRLGERKAKYFFAVADDEGYVVNLTYKQFMAHSTEYADPGEYTQKEVLRALLAQIVQFNKKLDYNQWVKKNQPTFMEKVEKLLGMGAKWTKAGLLSV